MPGGDAWSHPWAGQKEELWTGSGWAQLYVLCNDEEYIWWGSLEDLVVHQLQLHLFLPLRK
jgi:hypothetical protein